MLKCEATLRLEIVTLCLSAAILTEAFTASTRDTAHLGTKVSLHAVLIQAPDDTVAQNRVKMLKVTVAEGTNSAAGQVLQATNELSQQSETLTSEVGKFFATVRAA